MQQMSVYTWVPATLPSQNLQGGKDKVSIYVGLEQFYVFFSCAAVPEYNLALIEHKHYYFKEQFGPMSPISVSQQVFI